MKPPKDEGNNENPDRKIYHIDSGREKTHDKETQPSIPKTKAELITTIEDATNEVTQTELFYTKASLNLENADEESKGAAQQHFVKARSAYKKAKLKLKIAKAEDKQRIQQEKFNAQVKKADEEKSLLEQKMSAFEQYENRISLEDYINRLEHNPLSTDYALRVEPDLWRHTLIYKNSFKIKSTVENFELLIKYYGISIRYNQITKDMDVAVPGIKHSIDNDANASISLLKSIAKINDLNSTDIADYMLLVADKNRYNPVTDWITSRPWDGIGRIDALLGSIQAKDEEVKQVLMRRWLINCIANVFDAKPKGNAGVLVFQGGQGLGKTKWFKRLAPDWIKDGITLSAGNKDSVLGIIKHWIVELGELDATFRKSDISNLKSFITSDSDSIRRPYARTESYYPRRTAFFGSVNDENFLIDETGNRRYWTIATTRINHNHRIDMQQLWAEVYESQYQAGEEQWLNSHEFALMMKANEAFEVVDPIEDGVRMIFAFDDEGNNPRLLLSGKQILHAIGINEPNRGQSMKLANILEKMGIKSDRTKKGRLYLMPHKTSPKSTQQ